MEKRMNMEKNDSIINFKERKDEKMMCREDKKKIDELVENFENMEISESVEARIQETYRKILGDSAGKN